MNAQEVFISCLMILMLFNIFYIFSDPEISWNLTLDVLTGFISGVIANAVITGVSILGSGLNSSSTKIIFGVGSILNLLFQIKIANIPIGLGLATNLFGLFGTEFFGLGLILISVLALITIVSGLMTILG